MSSDDLRALKRRLSERLLAVQGVSGVGLRGGRLTVYVVQESPDIRQAIQTLVASESPGIPVRYVVTGAFSKQSRR